MRASRLQVLLALAASDLVGAASVGASALHSHYLPTAFPSRTTSPACMAGKKVAYGDEARASLIRGVDKVANAVKVTIGPRGRNVVIRRGEQMPVVINDGVSIAMDVDLELPEEQVGAKLLLQACSKTDSRAGDGTTTSAVLTQALCNSGAKLISNGANAVALQRGLNKAARFFVEKIRTMASPVDTIEQYRNIASISANSEDMGAIVADALMRVGADGACTSEAGKELTDSLEFAEGLEHDLGWINEAFVNNQESQVCEMADPRIFITDQKLTTMQDILPVLEAVVASKEPLLIMALDISGDALSGLALNAKKGVLDVCAIKTPGYGDVRTQYLEDIAIFTGATFMTQELGRKPENATMADLGTLSRAVISKSKTLLVSNGQQDDAVQARVETLKQQIDSKLNTEKEFEIQRLEQRITLLRGAVARIFIGAPTEAEIEDKRLRYEDSINALKGACLEGQVPGGGACYAYMLRFEEEARAAITDPDEAAAIDVLLDAMSAPLKQIASNAGELGEMVLEKVKGQEWGYGFNAKTLTYEDLDKAGVNDPASVNTWALENSASIAGSLLTTEALVCQAERPEDEEEYRPEITTGIGEDAARYAW